MYIDTHCHISDEYYDNIDKVIKEDIDAGVEKIIVSFCTKDEIEKNLDIIYKYPEVYATIGYHPEDVNNITDEDILKLEDTIKSNNKVIGIGEIGLDYHYGKENIEKQKNLFIKQLDLAQKLKLPVVIHTRDATEDTINILKRYSLKGIIHCFSGSLETAKIYISMGYKLGIGGVVTFNNSKLSNVVKQISLSDIVLETDSPYLAPQPFRGKINSSKYIPVIAEKISEIKNVKLEEISTITLENTYNLFDLNS